MAGVSRRQRILSVSEGVLARRQALPQCAAGATPTTGENPLAHAQGSLPSRHARHTAGLPSLTVGATTDSAVPVVRGCAVLDWLTSACEYLGGARDVPPAGVRIGVRSPLWGLWWGVLVGLIAVFSGQSSRFIYIDF